MTTVGIPKLKFLVEYVPDVGVYVVTAFDEAGVMLCDGDARTAEKALARCKDRLLGLIPQGQYHATIDVMNPSDDESDGDCR